MKILFGQTILALGAFRGEAFAPIYGGMSRQCQSCQKPTAALFSAVPRLDNDSNQVDRDDLFTTERPLLTIPDGAVLGAMALASGTFAAYSDSFMSLISAGAAILFTGAAMAAFTASLSKSSSDEPVEDSKADAFPDTSPMKASELRLADFLENPKSLRSDSASAPVDSSTFETVSHTRPTVTEPQVWTDSTSATDYRQSTTPNEVQEPWVNVIHQMPSFSSPLEVVNDGASTDAMQGSSYSEDVYHKPLVPATALYSSKGAQLDAAPVPLRTKIERIKAELELHDKFFDEL